MYLHNIALALADTRVADLQGATTHSTATAPPCRQRRQVRALALLGLAATAALAALAPTGALAQPTHDAAGPANARVDGALAPKPAQDLRALAKTSSLTGTTAASPAASASQHQDMRSPDGRDAAQAAQARQDLRSPDARDAAEGRGTVNGPQVVVVKAQPQTRPALTNGIDWADAGIGAGGMLGLILLALGSILAVVHRRQRAVAGQPASTA
jgi:hypothetical protein